MASSVAEAQPVRAMAIALEHAARGEHQTAASPARHDRHAVVQRLRARPARPADTCAGTSARPLADARPQPRHRSRLEDRPSCDRSRPRTASLCATCPNVTSATPSTLARRLAHERDRRARSRPGFRERPYGFGRCSVGITRRRGHAMIAVGVASDARTVSAPDPRRKHAVPPSPVIAELRTRWAH